MQEFYGKIGHTDVCIGRTMEFYGRIGQTNMSIGRNVQSSMARLAIQLCVSAELCGSSMARLDTQLCVSAELCRSMAGLDRHNETANSCDSCSYRSSVSTFRAVR